MCTTSKEVAFPTTKPNWREKWKYFSVNELLSWKMRKLHKEVAPLWRDSEYSVKVKEASESCLVRAYGLRLLHQNVGNISQILIQPVSWTFCFIVMQVVMISHSPINSSIALCRISFCSWMAISSTQNGFFRAEAVHDKQILLSDAELENSFQDSSWNT